MKKWVLLLATFFGLIGIIAGAFGAHALKEIIDTEHLRAFETGVRYQLFHAIVLLILGFQREIQIKWIAPLMIIGLILFSGSIYLLSCKAILDLTNTQFLGPITPLGGSILIISWVLLFLRIYKHKFID